MNTEQEYRDKYPLFEAFTKRLETLIETILKDSGIKYHLVESRTKSIESYCEKVNRKQHKYTNPIEDIKDKSALRIIVYYIDDLENISQVLGSNFQIDRNNSFDAKNNLSESQFGYLSSHYVVKLKGNRYKLPEWNIYKDFTAEIQVRTALQHAWAAISHELEYKKTYDIPSILKRRLFRLAGLIELADEEFQKAKEEHINVERSIIEKKAFNNIDIYNEINLNTIQQFFENKRLELIKIEKDAEKAGFTIANNDETLIAANNQYFSDIIEACNLKNIKTIDHFNEHIQLLSKSSAKTLADLFAIEGTEWIASIEFLVMLLMITSLTKEQIAKYSSNAWEEDVWDDIKEYILSKTLE